MDSLICYDPETGEIFVMHGEMRLHVYYIQRELSPEQAISVINRDIREEKNAN